MTVDLMMEAPKPGEPIQATISAAERYERGLALKNAGLYKAAIDQFELAVADPGFAVKAYAQIGLCLKVNGMGEEAVAAFRKALACSTGSSKETVQVLYLLGRTLEFLGRIEETLEAYRWIRREDPGYRDVAARIEQLSSRRSSPFGKKSRADETGQPGGFLKIRQTLLGTSK
ncbi:MAG: tetratricopeptide repeat protein [Nitrospira sp.]|nr:tetratricopeptide repeat protein [Nitrospira sp.]